MSEYTPDKWIVVKIGDQTGATHYRVFGTWYGGYLDGDSWRLNSGIAKVERSEKYTDVFGESGSVYRCWRNNEGLSMYGSEILEQLKVSLTHSEGFLEESSMEEAVNALG